MSFFENRFNFLEMPKSITLPVLQRNVAALGKHKTDSMESFVTELLKLKWAGQGEEVSSAYIGFLVNLVSANTRFARPAIKNILGNFQGNDREVDSEIFSNR